jgi:hypothetical protein
LLLLLLSQVLAVAERVVRTVLYLGVAALRAARNIRRVRHVAGRAAQRVRDVPVGLAHVLSNRLEALVAEPQAATSLQTLLRRVARALRPVLLSVLERVQQTHKLVIVVDVIVGQLLVLIQRVRARLALKLAHRARLLELEAVRVRRKVALLLAVLHPLVLRLRVVAAALGIPGKLVDTRVAARLALRSR